MKNNYFKFIFLPILMIGLLFSFSACGDDEKDEVKDETLYQCVLENLPAIEVGESLLKGYWIETSEKKCFYGGLSKTVGDNIYYERMYEKQYTTYDINDFSRDYNESEGVKNALSSFVLMQNGDCDYLSQYRMYYILDNSPSFQMRGYWCYLNNGFIHVVIINKQEYSDDEEINIDYKIISFDGDEMTLRQMGEYMVVDKVFKRFDIETVNQALAKEKEMLDKDL
ncbi:MAG: hypothetical protein UE068_06565 [Paludibacteraceae bacterium]|nr:hypothetical protein [Paludibacteraceae bacterium]